MKNERLQNELLIALNGNTSLLNQILEEIISLDEKQKDILCDVIKAENELLFFSENHYSETKIQKDKFDYKTSKEISRIIGLIYPPLSLENVGFSMISQKVEAQEIFESLEKNGFFLFPDKLDSGDIEIIKSGISKCSFIKNPPTHELYQIESEKDLKDIDTNTLWVFDNQKVLEIPIVQKIIQDKNTLKAIEKYLGCQPIHVSVTSWWSKFNKLDDISLNYGAQLFHQDKEFIKFVKIFIYLTDVDEKNGPHEYISGSHKDYSNNTPENYKMSDRLSDEYLKTKYSAERFNSFTGEAGTIIITDSNGFHKGKPLLEGQRLLLQLEFASSLYFNSLPAFATEGLTLEYQSFLKNNMRFAQNYDNERYKNDRKRRNYKRVGFFFETLKLRFKIVIKKILGIS